MLWVGTYAEKGGKGLYPVELNNGSITLGTPEARIADASFATFDDRTRTAYFVEERDAGNVTAWHFISGRWQERGRQTTGGALPCYAVLHPSATCLAVANYGDGSVALIEVDPTSGTLGELRGVRHATGQGPNRERQAGAHAHCVLFDEDGSTLFHVDLGADRIFAYPVEQSRLGEPEVALAAPGGSGPRHLLLLPSQDRALLLCELSAELMLLERRGASFTILDKIKTAPEPAPADNLGGHLSRLPDGRILVTNRGHDSLVSFAITNDRLKRTGWVRTGGRSPRHLCATPAGVLIAHEEGGGLTLVKDPEGENGGSEPLAQTELAGAVFILEISD